jgi:hypothetical protein
LVVVVMAVVVAVVQPQTDQRHQLRLVVQLTHLMAVVQVVLIMMVVLADQAVVLVHIIRQQQVTVDQTDQMVVQVFMVQEQDKAQQLDILGMEAALYTQVVVAQVVAHITA